MQVLRQVLTNIPLSQFRRASSFSGGLAVLWVALALIRTGTTFHLAPALVAVVFPVTFAYDSDGKASTRDLALATLGGLGLALLGTLILTVAGELTGPSLLPFGGAVTEAVIFAIAGAATGFVIGALRRT